MHSGQSAYKLKLQQRHPLMRMRSDLRAETIAAAARGDIRTIGGGRECDLRWFRLVHDLHHDWSFAQGETTGPRGAGELVQAL